MADKLWRSVKPFEQKKLLYAKQREIIESPKQKIRPRSVPYTRERPDDKQVQIGSRPSASVSAERDIDIFSEI